MTGVARKLVTSRASGERARSSATIWNARFLGLTPGHGSGGQSVIAASDPLPVSPLMVFVRDVVPPSWERASSELRAAYASLALSVGAVDAYAVSVNLGGQRISDAIAAGRGPLDHLRREVVRRLERALGRKVDLWLSLESKWGSAHTGALSTLHLHGGVGLRAAEVSAAKRALMVVARGFYRPKAVDVRLVSHAVNWGRYAAKDAEFMEARFGQRNLTLTNALRTRAKRIYGVHASLIRGELTSRASARQKGAA